MLFDTERLKELNPIEDVVEEFEFPLDRKGRGKHWKGLQHDSFVVNVDDQLYFWNSQGRGGDVFSFLEQECNMTFQDAAKFLAERAHVPWKMDEEEVQRMAAQRKRADTLTSAMGFLRQKLVDTREATAYCAQRGWTAETMQAARLGYWDGDRKGLFDHLRMAGADAQSPAAQAVASIPPGMLVYGHWAGQRCEYVSGRSIEGKEHYNPPSRLMEDRLPFWNHAVQRNSERLVIVEGQADAVSLGQWEVPAIALAGLTAGHMPGLTGKLNKYGLLYLALDDDEAGRKNIGALAGLLGPKVRIVSWPGGHKDANEWLKAGGTADACAKLLEAAYPYVLWIAKAAHPDNGGSDADRLKVLEVAAALDNVHLALWRDDLKERLGMSVGAMSQAIRALKKEPVEKLQKKVAARGDKDDFLLRTQLMKEPLDHEGHAQCVMALFPEQFAYVPEWGWMAFDGQKYIRKGGEALVERAVTHTLRQRQQIAREVQNDDLFKAAGASYPNVAGVRQQLQSMCTLTTDDFDNEPDLLNVANGVLNLRSGELEDHSPANRFTYCLETPYRPEAAEEGLDVEWLSWLYQAVGNGDAEKTQVLVNWLQEVVGYCLTGHIREEMFVYMYGPTRSGKGTFAETLMELMGTPLAAEVQMETFTSERDGDRSNFDLAPLSASRLVFADETRAHKRLNSTGMKHITGGGQLYASHKFKEHFNFTPKFMVLMASNWKLNMDADDRAAWGRARVVAFPHSWLGHEDRDLKRRMKSPESLQGVLAWAVEGAKRWYARGFLETPDAVQGMTEEQRDNQDLVGEFLYEMCDVADPENTSVFTGTTELHQSYTNWCKLGGVRPKGRGAFKQSMEEKGFGDGATQRKKIGGKTTRGYFGILLLHESEKEGQIKLPFSAG